MIVRVKLFAVAKQVAGGSEVAVEVGDVATIADVERALTAAEPALADAPGIQTYRGMERVQEQQATDAGAAHRARPASLHRVHQRSGADHRRRRGWVRDNPASSA